MARTTAGLTRSTAARAPGAPAPGGPPAPRAPPPPRRRNPERAELPVLEPCRELAHRAIARGPHLPDGVPGGRLDVLGDARGAVDQRAQERRELGVLAGNDPDHGPQHSSRSGARDLRPAVSRPPPRAHGLERRPEPAWARPAWPVHHEGATDSSRNARRICSSSA